MRVTPRGLLSICLTIAYVCSVGASFVRAQVAAGEEDRALEPDFLKRVDRLESFVSAQPWIRKTFSVVDILKESGAEILPAVSSSRGVFRRRSSMPLSRKNKGGTAS